MAQPAEGWIFWAAVTVLGVHAHGAPARATCPHCRQGIDVGVNFCPHCGTGIEWRYPQRGA